MDGGDVAGNLVPLFSQEELAATIKRLAAELDRDYSQRSPVLVGVLKGAFVFLADLVRQMKTPLRSIEFLQLSSYGPARVSAGRARVVVGLPPQTVRGQDVVVVEDIVDTGITTATALRYLKRRQPASLKVCALLNKPSHRQVSMTIDYLGLTVPDKFLVGYGLDLDQQYRQLPEIYALE
jgi:hypoxanthine phosphoribosyltransferase